MCRALSRQIERVEGSKDVVHLGVIKSLVKNGMDPDELYEKLKRRNGGRLDKCVLYQFQGAVLDIPWWECKNLRRK
ncbi:MAG: hypothetical protein HQ596_04055 [Candidatus Saganbacteria bacterium]|nr:hypothetical protein [Candidatus Saganbacteria bacterium]